MKTTYFFKKTIILDCACGGVSHDRQRKCYLNKLKVNKEKL